MEKRTERPWTVADSAALYNLDGWGQEYFSIAAEGRLCVHPRGSEGPAVDLKKLVDQIRQRGIGLPLLLRFSELIASRLKALHSAFDRARATFEYPGDYRGVYPIKVNQDRYLVERLLCHGRPYHFGLEAGSKPELLAVLALLDDPDALIVCNGYKDREYVETAFLASKLGRTLFVVVEKPSEVDLIAEVASTTDARPHIGLRAKLGSRGSGRWQESGGDRAKFGLSARELVDAVDTLRNEDLLASCRLLHFHIGSQIASIQAVQDAMQEAARLYVELTRLGVPLSFLDVGGGLGVDYTGSPAISDSTINYSLQEYANDVVSSVLDICQPADVVPPTLVTEAGRATVAHHAVLVVDVLDTSIARTSEPATPKERDTLSAPSSDAEPSLHHLYDVLTSAQEREPLETFHDALNYRDRCLHLFRLGHLSLEERALAEDLFTAICARLQHATREMDNPPEELLRLQSQLAATYFCNFSVFQSLPDTWAIQQLFPVVPLHRLDRRPTERAVLADITCDSDGKLDRFVGANRTTRSLRLQPLEDEYVLGIFLVGAYQESLGDLHNLFGDANTVAVSIDSDDQIAIDEVTPGDTVMEVLQYVHYDRRDLLARIRRATEQAVRNGRMEIEETRELLRLYEEGLAGYTYLEGMDRPEVKPR